MKIQAKIKVVVVCLMLMPMAVLSASSDLILKSQRTENPRLQKQQPSAFKTEFTVWAAKQDWFALSAKAEFGDLNREKLAEKGMTFGYSIEFLDSKGKRHILGVGLAREVEMEGKDAMKRRMAEMSARKNILMHGKTGSKDPSGSQSRSASGTITATQILSRTIVRPGTNEKWILCVCTGTTRVGNKTATVR